MAKSPQRIAWELFRENKMASAFDITFCVEAEVPHPDRSLVNAVLREYDRLRASAQQLETTRRLAGLALPEPTTDFRRTV